jgi:hypothetical protein
MSACVFPSLWWCNYTYDDRNIQTFIVLLRYEKGLVVYSQKGKSMDISALQVASTLEIKGVEHYMPAQMEDQVLKQFLVQQQECDDVASALLVVMHILCKQRNTDELKDTEDQLSNHLNRFFAELRCEYALRQQGTWYEQATVETILHRDPKAVRQVH